MEHDTQQDGRGPIRDVNGVQLSEYHTAYFYLVQNYAPGSYSVKAYEYVDIYHPLNDVKGLVNHLVQNATGRNGTDPRCYGTAMDELMRRRKSYFIVASDKYTFDDNEPVTFAGVDTYGATNDGKHTFFLIEVLHHVPTATGGTVDVAVYGNEMISSSANGSTLRKKEWEDYRITLNFIDAKHDERLLFDGSGGTNMGPPPPPPVR
jgi:hypothetical protein